MSTSDKKKKVIGKTAKKVKVKPTVSRRKQSSKSSAPAAMLFEKDNFKWMFIGLAFIAVGMILMTGGSMPSPDVWDDSLIYSFRRITLAPMIILIGLGIEIYAIFK